MDKKQNALIALLVFSTERIIVYIINVNRVYFSQSIRLLFFNILTIIFLWVLPLFIVYRFEHRDLESLGLQVPKSKHILYLSFGVLGILVPSFFLGFQNLFVDLFEQILFIGLAEEVFYRGYLMTRLCEWKGEKLGLFLNSIIFSLAHITFIISNEGVRHPMFIATTALQTFFGGVILGYIFLREGNIVPGVIVHMSTNLYLQRIFS